MSKFLPRADEYQLAVQNPQAVFSDPDLRISRVETNHLGLPVVASGGFALTYKFTGSSGVWAVRCFHKPTEDRRERYQSISNFLGAISSPYLVDIQYQSSGIRVRGEWFPLTKMKWVPGEPLNLFIERNIANKPLLEDLPEQFRMLVADLSMRQIAHGDLQHGNILVTNGRMHLVDYDGMFVPDLLGFKASELGHPNYQHPARSIETYGPDLDRFSSILIFLALKSVSLDPSLWHLHAAGGEHLLFQQRDVLDPDSSQVVESLSERHMLSEPIARFREICLGDIASVPSLEQFIQGAYSRSTTRWWKHSSRPPVRQVNEVIRSREVELITTHQAEKITIVGQVTEYRRSTSNTGRPYVFLNFGHWWQGCFYIALWSECLDLFKRDDVDPVDEYLGKWVSVSGVISIYGTRPQIAVRMPSEITVLADETEAESLIRVGSAGASANSPTVKSDPGPVPHHETPEHSERDAVLTALYSDNFTERQSLRPTSSNSSTSSSEVNDGSMKSRIKTFLSSIGIDV